MSENWEEYLWKVDGIFFGSSFFCCNLLWFVLFKSVLLLAACWCCCDFDRWLSLAVLIGRFALAAQSFLLIWGLACEKVDHRKQ